MRDGIFQIYGFINSHICCLFVVCLIVVVTCRVGSCYERPHFGGILQGTTGMHVHTHTLHTHTHTHSHHIFAKYTSFTHTHTTYAQCTSYIHHMHTHKTHSATILCSLQELMYVVAFVAKVLESCADSLVFKPPNPWSMAIMAVLCELHVVPDLKVTYTGLLCRLKGPITHCPSICSNIDKWLLAIK